jgi:L,D-peptidoglycan transpeptidase YkuD (ErfK/YbiS/YcfS/YnhG family)
MKRAALSRIRVAVSPRDRRLGWLLAGHMRVRCALGRTGPTRRKREGDGATPIGRFALLQLFYRPDKGPRPRSLLPMRAIAPEDGWCDAPGDRAYNTRVARPYPASHEEMWRDDGMYDYVLDIDYNRGGGRRAGARPLGIRKGAGSAIFMHVARPGFTPTAGCVALRKSDLRRLLPRLGRRTRIVIG